MTWNASHGYFCWHELLSTDPSGAKAFYPAVAGWTAQAAPMGDLDYTLFLHGDRQIAGLMQLPTEAAQMGAPSQWCGYVAVTDLDATLAAATSQGAQVYVPPMKIPGIGAFATLADPWGAAFCVLQPEGDDGRVPPAPGVGGFTWNELYTEDVAAAVVFYQGLFGWDLQGTHAMGAMGPYQLLGKGDQQFVGLMKRPAEMPVCAWLSYICVDDLAQAAQAVKIAGGQVLMGPHQVPGGSWILHIADPQGTYLALHQQA